MQFEEPTVAPDTGDGPAVSGDDGAPGLDQLEADIASVASALETLDRLLAEAGGDGGSMRSASADIARVVSPERFPVQ